jgi:hypothetical protein
MVNHPKLLYDWLRLEVRDHHLTEILDSLGQNIREISTELDHIAASNDEEWHSVATDDAAEWLENVLGFCFVICQVYLDRVGQRLEIIGKRACQAHVDLGMIPRTKWAALDCGELLRTCKSITQVRAINNLANYFKHRAQWDKEWKNLSKDQMRTVDTLKALGCKPRSCSNFRKAAKFFGNGEYYNTMVFEKIVRSWAEGLLEAMHLQLSIDK